MTYGIAGLAQGFNQGLEMRREQKRQDEFDSMAREQHDMGIQAGQQNLRAARQQYGIQGANFRNQQEDRSRILEEEQFNDEWTRAYQRYEMAGDPTGLAQIASQRLFDGTPAQIQAGEREYQITVGDQQFAVPREEFDAWARSMVDPGARTQYRHQLQAAIAEQEQGGIDHQRNIQQRLASRVPGDRITMGEGGQLGVREPTEQELAAGTDPTAKMREVQALARAQGITEGEAWNRILSASGRPPEQAIPDIARMLMDADRDLRRNPDAAFEKAQEMFLEFRNLAMQGGGYGIGEGGQQPPGMQQQPAGVTEPAASAGQITIDNQQIPIDRVLREATEIVLAGEASLAETAGYLVELGVPEEIAQRWQRENAGADR